MSGNCTMSCVVAGSLPAGPAMGRFTRSHRRRLLNAVGLNQRIVASQRPLLRCLQREVTARSSSPRSRDGSAGSGDQSPQVPEPDSPREPLTSRRRALLSLPTAAAGSSLAVNGSRAAPAAAVADAAAGGKQEAVSVATGCLPTMGIQAIRDPALNRGLATAPEAREALGVVGLLPSGTSTLENEVARALQAVRGSGGGLAAYQQLAVLRATNEAVFFALLQAYPAEMLPLVYTPVVGDACLNWGKLMLRPQGLYISISDVGRVAERLAAWPAEEVAITVVTDGERILGLGDLGAHGMGISVGKGMLYTVAGGVPPAKVLPVVIDAGCDVSEVRDDPFYVGLKQPRVRGQAYDMLVDELVTALKDRYGSSMLLHWEDFGAKDAFRLLSLYQKKALLPTFNDDIQSTAAAVLAAMLGAVRVSGVPPLAKQRVLFFGAGQANLGAAKLFVAARRAEGATEAEAKQQIWLMDREGLLTTDRADLSREKAQFARGPVKELEGAKLSKVVRELRPTALIGAASVQGAFTQEVIERLTTGMQSSGAPLGRPVVMALSNPLTRSECTAEEALLWSGEAAVFASGTKFGAVKRKAGEDVFPSQANNSLIFPGIGMGCLASGATRVTDEMFYAAAKAVAESTTDAELRRGSVLPSIDRIRQVTEVVAARVAEEAVTSMVATNTPQGALSCLQNAQSQPEASDMVVLQAEEDCVRSLQYRP